MNGHTQPCKLPSLRRSDDVPHTVGAGVVIYRNKQMIMQYRYKIRSYGSNNQAEQIAILKVLEQLQVMEAPIGGRAAIYTERRVTKIP